MPIKRKPAVEPSNPPAIDNRPKPLAALTAAEQRLWDTVILTTPGLGLSDAVTAFSWVRLVAKFARAPDSMHINEQRLMHQLGSRLGFSPTQRKRLGSKASRLAPAPLVPKKRFEFDYFNDGSGGPARKGRGT
jgi:hypothetical protein